MHIPNLPAVCPSQRALNKGRIVDQKRPLLSKHVWAIRVRLEIAGNYRDLALFNSAIDSKLRGCDLVTLRVADVFVAGQVKERTSIIQSKHKSQHWVVVTKRPNAAFRERHSRSETVSCKQTSIFSPIAISQII